jgi:hypothetical protein
MSRLFNDLGIKEGRGFLEGICDYVRKARDEYEYDQNGYLFRLNGRNYAIWENPDDGYRSYCEMEETDQPCSNTFPPQEVFVELYDCECNYERNQGIMIRNIDDASLILKLGTDNYDDYYPTAVMEWHPENLPINKF